MGQNGMERNGTERKDGEQNTMAQKKIEKDGINWNGTKKSRIKLN